RTRAAEGAESDRGSASSWGSGETIRTGPREGAEKARGWQVPGATASPPISRCASRPGPPSSPRPRARAPTVPAAPAGGGLPAGAVGAPRGGGEAQGVGGDGLAVQRDGGGVRLRRGEHHGLRAGGGEGGGGVLGGMGGAGGLDGRPGGGAAPRLHRDVGDV